MEIVGLYEERDARLGAFLEKLDLGYLRLSAGGQILGANQHSADLWDLDVADLLKGEMQLQELVGESVDLGEFFEQVQVEGSGICELSVAQLRLALRLSWDGECFEGSWELLSSEGFEAELWRAAVEALPQGINLTDESGQILYTNQAAQRLLELPEHDYHGRLIDGPEWSIIDERGEPLRAKDYASTIALREQRPVLGIKMGVLRSDDSLQWLQVDAVPLAMPGFGLVISFADVTECREQGERFCTMFDENRLVMLLIDPKGGGIIRANQAAVRFYGYSRNQLQAMGVKDLDQGSEEDVEGRLKEAWEERGHFLVEHQLANGEIRTLEVYASPMRYQGKKVLFSTTVDVTERESVQAKLRRSEKRFVEITSSIQDFLYILDTQERHAAVFGPWVGNYGFTEEYFLGFTPIEIVGEALGAVHHEANQRALAGEAVVYSSTIPSGKGQRHFQTSLTPIRDEEGVITGVLGVGRDITELVQAREEIREREARYRLLVEGSADGLFLSDVDGHFVDVNRAACVMTGYSRAELTSMQICDVDPSYPRERVAEVFGPLEPGDELTITTSIHRQCGRVIPVEIVARCFDWQGERRFVYLARDISKRLVEEKKRLEMERELVELQKNKSLALLAGGVAHDFNNILAGVLGNAELALDELNPRTEIYEMIDEIRCSALRAKELGKQMLAYSGKGQFQLAVVNPNELIAGMRQTLLALIQHRTPVIFQFTTEPPNIRVDTTQLRQIIQNLIVNADEAVGVDGRIKVRTARYRFDGDCPWIGNKSQLKAGDYALISVSDNGSGIERAELERIFEPFYSTKFTGRGLGLAASQGIMTGHEGAILVETELGGGSTFHLLFPISVEETQKAKPNEAEPAVESLSSRRRRVLLVDDEEVVLRVTRRMLERMDFSVNIARNGAEALSFLLQKEGAVDLVLLDMMMPVMDGEKTLEHIRSRWPTLPVLMCSGYNEQEMVNLHLQNGLYGFLQKPYQLSSLREKLSELLD